MIKNERQYKITKSQIAKFEASLEELTARSGAKSRLRKLEEDALRQALLGETTLIKLPLAPKNLIWSSSRNHTARIPLHSNRCPQ